MTKKPEPTESVLLWANPEYRGEPPALMPEIPADADWAIGRVVDGVAFWESFGPFADDGRED